VIEINSAQLDFGSSLLRWICTQTQFQNHLFQNQVTNQFTDLLNTANQFQIYRGTMFIFKIRTDNAWINYWTK
jgi:hypothetical protein